MEGDPPSALDVLELVRGVGSVLHASAEERAASTLRVARGGGGCVAAGSDRDTNVARARAVCDGAWAAAARRGGGLWGQAFGAARAQLGVERGRVDNHASSPADYYAVVSSYSHAHERLLACARDAARSALFAAGGSGDGDLARSILFFLLFLRGKEAAAAQRGYGAGALTARAFPGAARQALLAAIGAADATREAVVLVAPGFVDADALSVLLAPPREYAILQARLLAASTSAEDVGFGRHTALDVGGFLALMTRWVDDRAESLFPRSMRRAERDFFKSRIPRAGRQSSRFRGRARRAARRGRGAGWSAAAAAAPPLPALRRRGGGARRPAAAAAYRPGPPRGRGTVDGAGARPCGIPTVFRDTVQRECSGTHF